MTINIQVLTERIHEHSPALGNHFKVQSAPGGPILWTRPAGVDGRKDTIFECQHLQSAGFHLDFIGVEYPVTARVHCRNFRASKPAHDIYEMDGMIHNRAAPSKFGVHKPVAMFSWQLTAIGSIEAIDITKVAIIEARFDLQYRYTETQRESRHEKNTGFVTYIYNGLCVFERCCDRFLT